MFAVVRRSLFVAAVCFGPATAGHARIDVRMEASRMPPAAKARLSSAGGAAFLATAASLPGNMAGSAGPEFDRETQAPLIWMNLHKPPAPSLDGAPVESFDGFASQRIAQASGRR